MYCERRKYPRTCEGLPVDPCTVRFLCCCAAAVPSADATGLRLRCCCWQACRQGIEVSVRRRGVGLGVINRKSRFAPNGCRSGFLALLLIGRKRAGELIRLIRPPRLSKRIPFGNNASVRDMWCWCCDATRRREARRARKRMGALKSHSIPWPCSARGAWRHFFFSADLSSLTRFPYSTRLRGAEAGQRR